MAKQTHIFDRVGRCTIVTTGDPASGYTVWTTLSSGATGVVRFGDYGEAVTRHQTIYDDLLAMHSRGRRIRDPQDS